MCFAAQQRDCGVSEELIVAKISSDMEDPVVVRLNELNERTRWQTNEKDEEEVYEHASK